MPTAELERAERRQTVKPSRNQLLGHREGGPPPGPAAEEKSEQLPIRERGSAQPDQPLPRTLVPRQIADPQRPGRHRFAQGTSVAPGVERDGDNALPMVTIRSERIAPWALAAAGLLAVLSGVAGMWSAAQFAADRGWELRAVLVTGEMALLAVALLAGRSLGLHLGWQRSAAAPRLVSRGVLAGLALWIGSLGVVGLQQLVWPPPPGYLPAFLELHRALRPAGALDAVASLAAVALAPAVCEELLFRGVALPALVPLLRPAGAALASALLFGLIHVDAVGGELSLYRAPFAFAVGLGLAALRLRSGSVVAPILAHAALNACTWGVTLVALLALGPDAAPPEEAGAPVLAGAQLAVGFLALRALVRRWPAARV